jgi:hypothetical protein
VAADKKEAKKAANSLFQLGNSAEVIAQLEKDYDFSGVGVKEHEQAQKWYMATQPSRSYGPDVLSAYYMWLKWNPTSNGKPSSHYQGHLVWKREEEAGAAMAAAMEVGAAVGAAMAAVRLE